MSEQFSYNYGDYYSKDRFAKYRFDIAKHLLLPYIKENVKILDIGCYDGAMLDAIRKSANQIDYTGIDADSKALDIAASRGAKVLKLNIESDNLPFQSDSFDIIIIGEVLEHLKDPARILSFAKNVLKTKGILLVSLPNECTIYHRLKILFGRGIDGTGFAPGYHLHFPTLKQNEDFVQQFFKIEEKKYWYHLGVGGVLEKLLNFIPHSFLQFLVNLFPNLLARGIIILCKNHKSNAKEVNR